MPGAGDDRDPATATLTQFISLYKDGKLDNLDADMLGVRFDERVKAIVEEYLKKHLPSHLDKYLATNQDKQLYSTVISLSEKIGSLEARLSTTNTRADTNPPKERDFWFIQERARHLGVRLNADQLLRVEMFAAEAYKERHGKPPSKKLYRSNYASFYSKADVDIIDPLIRGVAARG